MTDEAVGGTATSSSDGWEFWFDPSSNKPVSNAFDKDSSSYWTPTTTQALPQYIEYDFATPKIIDAYDLTGSGLRQFEFQAWDGSGWVMLHGTNYNEDLIDGGEKFYISGI